jgi:hypothetical protein
LARIGEEWRMKINLHVERVILVGLSMGARDGALIQAAVEAELGRRLAHGGIPKDLQTAGKQDRLLAPALRSCSSPDAKALGGQIGAEVYAAISGFNQQDELRVRSRLRPVGPTREDPGGVVETEDGRQEIPEE